MPVVMGGLRRRTGLGRPFWTLWAAATVSGIGDGAWLAALPLLALTATHDPRLVGALTTASFLPWVLFSLLAGVLADRLDRRRLMWAAQGVQAALAAVVAVAAATGGSRLWLLYVVAFGLGTAQTLFENAAVALLPSVVAQERLQAANTRQYAASYVTTTLVGPPLGSLLFAVTAPLPFALDAWSFVLSALLIATIRRGAELHIAGTASSAAAAPDATNRSLRGDIVEGLRWLFGSRLLRALAQLVAVNAFCFQLTFSTLALLATHVLGVSARGYGILFAATGVGGLAGAFLRGRVVGRLGSSRALRLCLWLNVAAFLGVGLARDAWTAGAMLALSGASVMVWNVISVSLRQQLVPDQLLGRVNSVFRMLGWALMPFGGIAGGYLAHAFGLRAPWLAGAVLRLGALLLALPALRAFRTELHEGSSMIRDGGYSPLSDIREPSESRGLPD